jgi:hypothetical protein
MASPSWAHSRFASGYGPNRQEALLDSSERAHACACQFNIHIAGHCRMHRESSHNSHAARLLLTLPAGSRKTSHEPLKRSALLEVSDLELELARHGR